MTYSSPLIRQEEIVSEFSGAKENDNNLRSFLKLKSTEFSLYLYHVARGHRGGIEGARRGQGGINLIEPSLCPLYALIEVSLCCERMVL